MDACLLIGNRVGNGLTRRVKNFCHLLNSQSREIVSPSWSGLGDIRATILDENSYRQVRARAQIPTVPTFSDVSEKRRLNVLGTPLILNID